MRKLLITAAIAAAAAATPALASNTTSTVVNAALAQSCTIDSVSPSLTLGAVDAAVPGEFKYTCNFIGQPTVTIQSANGGVKTSDNGDATADYGVWVNDSAPSGAPSGWAQASALIGPGVSFGPDSGFLSSAAPNVQNSPYLSVALTTALPHAGNYTDTLTFTINP
jgi:spore coat protein U-like protein